LTGIPFRVFVEFAFTALTAKVVSLPLMLRLPGSFLFIHLHPADGIVLHCHDDFSYISADYLSFAHESPMRPE
jgi:hypothetical protein